MSTAWECINDAHPAEAGAGGAGAESGELDPKRWRSSVSPRWYAECRGDALHNDGFGVAAQGGPVWLAEPPAHQCMQRGAGLRGLILAVPFFAIARNAIAHLRSRDVAELVADRAKPAVRRILG